jgi:hypothetical protein
MSLGLSAWLEIELGLDLRLGVILTLTLLSNSEINDNLRRRAMMATYCNWFYVPFPYS